MYKCRQCDREFGTLQGMKVHAAFSHRIKDAKPATVTEPTNGTPKIKKKRVSREVALAFCPCCGTNIRMVSQALAAVEGLR